jgi:hypothetical protein
VAPSARFDKNFDLRFEEKLVDNNFDVFNTNASSIQVGVLIIGGVVKL